MKSRLEKRRRNLVAAVRRGASLRTVARQFGVSLLTVQRWVERAAGQRLDRVDFTDHPDGPRNPTNRVTPALEDLVVSIRHELREHSVLGEFGAAAIDRELKTRGVEPVPSLRTLGRILERRGLLDGRRRVRRRPPAKGWYVPEVAAGRAEIDEGDFISGLVIQGGLEVEVLTVISLHGGLVESWPAAAFTATTTLEALLTHWRAMGLPDYAQFDNDTRFQGPHQYPDTIGTIIRLCLSLEVVPVFVPPRELGFQAAIESYNGRWQAKVWGRFHHDSLAALQAHSAQYVAATRRRAAPRLEAAPTRRPVPLDWRLNLQATPTGRLIYLRRTTAHGEANLLGHLFEVDRQWVHRLIRCEVDIDAGSIRFYALRRREPDQQPLLRELPYGLSKRYFQE